MEAGLALVTPTRDTALALEALTFFATTTTGEITSDDVWRLLGAFGVTGLDHPNAMGAAFRKAASSGIIRPTNRVRLSKRVSARCRKVSVWESTREGRAK